MARTKESMYVAIDVGTTKIATLVAKVSSEGTMEVVAVGRSTSEGMRKGMVVSPEDLTLAVRRSVHEAEEMLGHSIPPAHVGITGGHLTCINAVASIDIATEKHKKHRSGKKVRAFSQDDVDRLLSSTAPETSLRQRVVHVIPRTFQVDGLDGIRNPVGMSGGQLGGESHVVIGDAATMDNLARVTRAAGVKVHGFVLEHLASAEAVLTAEEREIGTVLVDIGGGTSDLAIYKGGAAWFTTAIPVAGQHFTSDISIGLGLPPTVAEATKVRYGSAFVDGINAREMIDIEDISGESSRSVSKLQLAQLLHDRATELARLILYKIGMSGITRVPPGGIVLTGGCSQLDGLESIMADYGRCIVRTASPSSALGLPPELENSSYSTAVGLLLWAIHQRHAGAVARDVSVNQPVMDRLRGWLNKLGRRDHDRSPVVGIPNVGGAGPS
jgi:cell division protein FtsA